MFICTLRASNIRFFAVIVSAVALLITLVAVTQGSASGAVGADTSPLTQASAAPEAKISFDKIRTNEDRVAFLGQFGWEVSPDAIEEVTLKLPGEFDRIMNEYNEIQKSQGLDLSKYKGQEVVRYSYAVNNYPGYDGEVRANIIVSKNRVIGGDVCSADVNGFITSLYRPDASDVTPRSDETQGQGDQPAETAAAAAGVAPDIADAVCTEAAPVQ